MITAANLIETVKSKAMSLDSVRCIAYLLAARAGRTDRVASIIGQRIMRGNMTQEDADYLMCDSRKMNLSVWEDIEQHIGQVQVK
jgi:hypothetical protein